MEYYRITYRRDNGIVYTAGVFGDDDVQGLLNIIRFNGGQTIAIVGEN